MRRSFVMISAAVMFAGLPATAGPLAAATLVFQIGPLPPTVVPGAAAATGSATSSLAATLAAGTAFAGTSTTFVPPELAPITQIQVQLTRNAGLAWSGGAAPAAFQGIANLIGFSGITLLGVPLNLGAPSTVSASNFGVGITAIGASWTAGTATLTGVGTTPTTAMAAGSNGLSPDGVGTLVLVTPVKIVTSVAGAIPAFGRLTLTYVPEPGTLLLLWGAVAGLALVGRQRPG